MLDQSVLIAIILVLVGAMAYAIWQSRKREAFQEYDETSCVALAQTNKANVKELMEVADMVKNLDSQLTAIKSQVDANSESISAFVQQNQP
jgi:hypothetical protein